MIKYVIFYLIFAIISQFITYKFIKWIDKRERIKLRKWEDNYIDELIAHREKLKNMQKAEEIVEKH